MIPANRSLLIERWFAAYARRYTRQRFHAVHRLGSANLPDASEPIPLLVCLNHSSWWDVMLGLLLAHDAFGWEFYGVMDERQLQRYRFFTRVGMIGVDRTSLSGAKEFLEYATRLLQGRRAALWWTPQGEMRSNYARPIRFQPGLGHLAERLGVFYCVTVCFHYEFWNEPRPEAFLSLSPIERYDATTPDFNRRAFVQAQEQRMTECLDALLEQARLRDPNAFEPFLAGRNGISPTYDALRSLGARLRGRRFTAEHSGVATPQWKQTSSDTSAEK